MQPGPVLGGLAVFLLTAGMTSAVSAQRASQTPIEVDGTSFALNGDNVSYHFHVDSTTGDLIGDHFGGPVDGDTIESEVGPVQGWVNTIGRVRRELPDLGRGDFRIPAVQIRQSEGYTVSEFQYQGHKVVDGKPALNGLPSTFGQDEEVSTLVVHLYDKYSSVSADLIYSIFPKHDAIVRSVNVTNGGSGNITIERLASFSVDLPWGDYDMLQLGGDWAREGMRVRRKVDFGTQGFGSTTGYSSHLHNPFLAVVSRTTTESHGEAYGFSLVYTGSFAAEVEKSSQGLTRAVLGFNPSQLAWPLGPGESLQSPECVAIFSSTGIGGMSRRLHHLYRQHLMKSRYATETRPVLLNSWEGLGFDYNATTIYQLAQQSAELGARLFVMDDGWFGVKYPRTSDDAGLGDWKVNPQRFPDGLKALADEVTNLSVGNSSAKLKFGLWFEPEMVNPNSSLYEEHPDWALHAGKYPRTLTRHQLVLNVALPEVQEFIIDSVSNILTSSNIAYVKWDSNRGMHETPTPYANHQYMLGLYRVFDRLTERFPDVLWEGSASGGGRFDPGVLQYFPQIWTSDNTDAVERIHIQFGTSLAYPASAMGAHISATPNSQSGRNETIEFRAHVAMMGGSFGLELDPSHMPEQDRAKVPDLIRLAEKINPIVIQGDMWRLNLPEESDYPAALFISEDGKDAVLFYFQLKPTINNGWPVVRLQGLDAKAMYKVDGNQTVSGATLMNRGVSYDFDAGYSSRVVFFEKQ
ncbi:alpha-galactosidase [Metarhizium album ARSEF 1941]|uniref:Alpha-galactosidase n=1 Tax=Metarhizium album (strain ARSEF 1941) TaxID=1081103 RepID=A0A0B2WTE6_METAS|nr:alpha-galactosidase [Metarhizium album ARSEF 1941]KHN97288.1 alpha-galactosidase [Metarhizium album ARSEF 1941]